VRCPFYSFTYDLSVEQYPLEMFADTEVSHANGLYHSNVRNACVSKVLCFDLAGADSALQTFSSYPRSALYQESDFH